MSFSSDVKDDLSRVLSSKLCCRKAEFIAFFLINGNIRFGGAQRISLAMTTEHAAAARKMFTLAKEFLAKREIMIYRRQTLKKNPAYSLYIPPQEDVMRFLSAIGMLNSENVWQVAFPSSVEEDFLQPSCCRKAYLRGAFLAAGSVSNPENRYHLEIGPLDKSQAELLLRLMGDFELPAKSLERKGRELVYLQDGEHISEFLSIIGSHRSMLEFESVRVTKEVRNNVNRLRNCDNANINKTVAAAMRQCESIRYVLKEIGADILPPALRTVAELRLSYPEESLAGLSSISSLGRSALNHRLRRLEQIADNIRCYGKEEWNRKDD
ncbi:MAG: DNA-binding protein WhiA [Bacillota bacterium]|nr:DNA-binding protein WhiA [Bacillota bacterium]